MKKNKTKKTSNKRVMERILNTEAIKKEAIRDLPIDDMAVYKTLSMMRHRDMQKLCIEKGMDFKDVVTVGHHNMIAWIYKNWNNTEDHNKLIEFDAWQDTELAKKYGANDPLRNPLLKFSFTPLESKQKLLEIPKPEPSKKVEEDKPKRGKHEDWGIMSGTKKYLTYKLTIEDKLTLKEIVQKVKEQYPEAEEKSIKIWTTRALKFIKD